MTGLRELLEATTPGEWWVHAPGVKARALADARLISLAPELAALCLDTKALLVRILDRDHHGDFINGENAKPEDVAALLARLDRIGKEPLVATEDGVSEWPCGTYVTVVKWYDGIGGGGEK